MSTVLNVRNAAAAIAFDGPGTIHGNRCAAEAVHDARIDGNDVTGSTESIAGAEGIANGNAFHAATETCGEMANAGNGMREAATKKILVGDRHNGFAAPRAESGHAVGVRRVKEPGALEVQHGVKPGLAIGLSGQSKSPAAIAGLQGLIGDGDDGRAVDNGRTFAIANASRNFQTAAESDVAITFRGRAEEPGLYADLHVADAANAIYADRRVNLISRTLQHRNVGDDAPASRELIVDANVEKQLMVYDLIAIEGPLRLLIGPDEVPEGIEFAKTDGDRERAKPLGITIVC